MEYDKIEPHAKILAELVRGTWPPDKLYDYLKMLFLLSGPEEEKWFCYVALCRLALYKVFRQLVDLIMREGDMLVVTELERFGRNYTEIHNEWYTITKQRKMDIKVLDMPLLDTTLAKDLLGTLITDLILTLLAYVAHRERVEKKVLQKQGIERAHGRGVKFGRPVITYPDQWEEVYKEWKAGRLTARNAMKQLELKKDSFYKLVNQYENNSR